MVRGMYWPLIGGFIAFILFAVLMGWIMDAPNRRRNEVDPPGGGRLP
jgi:hypothetical protein